ncbi:hypothetical protein [Mucilaginibacter sp. dw_454]|uniref:hypothetical protein n=1 Tax=Mucilaginibacter sp. dw_454 TaxID=2720079 RepID=UPI001BD2CB05|nr:hypothetical protein [Mucilaginibacter sp. dw_454]
MKPLWGKMDAAQMMTHCTNSMNIAFGKTRCYRHQIGILLGNIAKRRLLKVDQFDRHIPSFYKLRIYHDCNFDEAKEDFLDIIKTALDNGEPSLVKYPHPYFKTFKAGEWCQLNWKHLDHH